MLKGKIFIAALIAICLLGTAAIAQTAQTGKMGRSQGIVKSLNLTQDQAKQIRDIVAKYHADIKNVAKSDISRDQKKSQVASLKENTKNAINAVLTPDQRDKAAKSNAIDKLLTAKPAAFSILKAAKQLNLTDAQKSQIKDIMKATKEKVKAVKSDSSLSADAKKTQIKSIRDAQQQQINSVLTPDQQQKLKDIMSKHSEGKGQK